MRSLITLLMLLPHSHANTCLCLCTQTNIHTCRHTHTCAPAHEHTHTHTCTDRSMGMILINLVNGLVRGLPYTSHLSSLLESGSALIVWKWGCINDVNPCKISSGYGGTEKQRGCCGREMERQNTDRQTDRKIAWWTERQPQGLTFSLHEFPHVSISHLFLPSVALISSTHLHLSAWQAVIIAWKIYI